MLFSIFLGLAAWKGLDAQQKVSEFPSNTSNVPLDMENDVFEREFHDLTCCMKARPGIPQQLQYYLVSYNVIETGPGLDHSRNGTGGCTRFSGKYSLKREARAEFPEQFGKGVVCKCPNKAEHLDRNCRHLPSCTNGGYRAFGNNLRCVCPGNYFGDVCEHYCYNGRRKKINGFDKCVCKDRFFGVECRGITCFQGGTPVDGRTCRCPRPYVGRHCEVVLEGELGQSKTSSANFLNRDLTGTIISLFLILGLAIAVYFLVKRRSDMARRRQMGLEFGRGEFIRNFFRLGRQSIHRIDSETGTDDPPSYFSVATSTGNYGNHRPSPHSEAELAIITSTIGDLPPPPAYDEALKLPTAANSNNHCNSVNNSTTNTSHNNLFTDPDPHTTPDSDNSVDLAPVTENSSPSIGASVLPSINAAERRSEVDSTAELLTPVTRMASTASTNSELCSTDTTELTPAVISSNLHQTDPS